ESPCTGIARRERCDSRESGTTHHGGGARTPTSGRSARRPRPTPRPPASARAWYRGRPPSLRCGSRSAEKVAFLRRRRSAEYLVALGKAAELFDDTVMAARVEIEVRQSRAQAPGRLFRQPGEPPDGLPLELEILGVLQGKIEERALEGGEPRVRPS